MIEKFTTKLKLRAVK